MYYSIFIVRDEYFYFIKPNRFYSISKTIKTYDYEYDQRKIQYLTAVYEVGDDGQTNNMPVTTPMLFKY